MPGGAIEGEMMEGENTKESTAVITGLGLTCVALFLIVSLYTHSQYDLMDYHAAQSREIQNKAGLVGAQLSHYAFCTYGIGAWVITGMLLIFGSVISATRSMEGLFSRSLGALLLTILVCAWTGAMESTVLADYPAGAGGLLGGTILAPPLKGLFGKVGVFLVLSLLSMLCCLLLAPRHTENLLALVGRGVVRAGHMGVDSVLGRTTQAAAAYADPEPAMASVSGRFEAPVIRKPEPQTINIPESAARVEVLPAPETRRLKIPLADLAAERSERRKPAPEEKVERPVKSEEPQVSRKSEEKKSAKVDAETAEAELNEKRRQEALRQAEVAEGERLDREKQAREQAQKDQREAKVLDKLEKERAAKDQQKAVQQEKFAAAMAAAAAAANPGAEPAEPAKPKPKLPVIYDLPKYDLLIQNDESPVVNSEALKERGATLIQTLWDFNIGSKLVGIQTGPTVSMFELELDPGIKVQRVVSLQDNLAMAMKAEHGVRIIAPIPGKATIGIEIPNVEKHKVCMRPILESPTFRTKAGTLPLILGRDAVGAPLFPDLAAMPHLLIAGTTGSGKSVCLNSIILSLMVLKKPHELKMILVDPKQVEMTDFKDIPHLLCPVVTDMKLAAGVLTWAVQKMEERYERMARVGVRNIATYNKMTSEERLAGLPQGECAEEYIEPMPYIVIIVDEFADLMMTAGKEIEQAIARMAQKARAAGLHVILATQRPSADVVTGLIKTNLPCRICFQVKSKIDSRIVLDQGGAEKLAGHGDMLYIGPGNSNICRAKGVLVEEKEIKAVVAFCKSQAEPVYSDEIERVARAASRSDEDGDDGSTNHQATEIDEKFEEGVEVFLSQGRASTSLLQRRMSLGYTRAAKLCDQMEARGIVGPDRGAKGRELLITQEGWQNYKRAQNGPVVPGVFGSKGSKDNPHSAASSAIVVSAPEPEAVVAGVNRIDPRLLDQLDGTADGQPEDDDDE